MVDGGEVLMCPYIRAAAILIQYLVLHLVGQVSVLSSLCSSLMQKKFIT